MNIEKIEINGHYVWVDTETVCETGELYLTHIRKIIKPKEKGVIQAGDKIIAASPELNLEGVPTYVDFICEQEAKKFHDKGKHENWDIYNQLVYEDKEMIIVGYKLAEKELQKQLITEIMNEDDKDGLYELHPTWDDVRKAITMARGIKYVTYSEEQIIELLKQNKVAQSK